MNATGERPDRALDPAHWKQAAELAAFVGTEPIWRIALGDGDHRLALAREVARQSLGGGHPNLFENALTERGCTLLRDFARNWLATDYIGSRPTDEVTNTLFLVSRRVPEIERFFADALSVGDLAASFAATRDPAADGAILEAVDTFEIEIVRRGTDPWEERFIAVRTLDPFVDLTYPLYRGYLARTQWLSAKSLFSARFGRAAMRSLVVSFQERHGPLEHADAWESLSDDQ